jgi:predicted DNA-binding transcriptional regulator YafY
MSSQKTDHEIYPRDTAIRYITMLSMIPVEPRDIGSAEILGLLEKQGFFVNQRTIQRDLNLLSTKFPLDCKPGIRNEMRWFFRKGSPAHWPAMSADTALAIRLSEGILTKILPQQVLAGFDSVMQQAKYTLDIQDKLGSRKVWAESVRMVPKGFTVKPPDIAADVMSKVYEAISRQRQLRITKNKKESVINPLGLVMRGLVVYLVCSYVEYGDIRLTALHRLSKAELLTSKRVMPEGFSLDGVLHDGIMHWRLDPGKSKQFELEVGAGIAQYLGENKIHDNQVIKQQKTGNFLVSFTTEDTLELRQWLLGFGASITIQKPVAVKRWITDTAQEIVKHYKV